VSAFPVIEDAFTGEVHPHAAKFPMLSADDFESLCDSIARGGMRHAILIDQHGQLLDGRNRLRACQELGIEPRFEVVVTDDPEDEINAANVETKPLSTGQRAMARALALVAQEKRKDGRWEDGSAQSVGRKTAESEALRRCGYILDRNPMLANEVLGGAVTLGEAYKDTCDEQDKADKRLDQLETLAAEAPDLHRRVTSDTDPMPLDEVWAAYLERTREERKRADDFAALIAKQNGDVQAAFATLITLSHPENLQRVMDNYRPLGKTWTAAELHQLADTLHTIADTWSVT